MTTNNYLIKALESYPYDLEQCMESLNYAISYDDNNPIALCLLGKIQLEVFKDYDEANRYFREALAANVNYLETYPFFLDCLLIQADFEEMEKLLAFASKRKGIDHGLLFYYEGLLLEKQLKFKKALKAIKQAMLFALSSSFMTDLDEMKKRVEKKMALK
jgi:tetratricopeptide (TPR) repeat protein